jgi:sporulation-control protein spo0M
MSGGSIQFHKIWIEQCEATQGIREHLGWQNALDYLVGEKLFHFVEAAEQHPEFAAELPAFVAEIQQLFTAGQIREYLDELEKTKYLAPPEPELDLEDSDEEGEEELWLENPVMGAEGLLRFFCIRQLLQP